MVLRGELVGRALGVVQGGDDEVLQRLQVVGVDRGRGDGDGGDVAASGHRRRHQTAAGRAGDLGVRELLLRGDQLLLHLLRLLQQLRHVGLASGEHATRVGRAYDAGREPDRPGQPSRERAMSWRTITLRWISFVPSPTIISGASRK